MDVVERATVVLMDDLGAILGGSLEPEVAAIRLQRMAVSGRGGPPSWRPGCRRPAAEVNGTAGCWLELDEGYRLAPCHAGVYTIPAALAIAEDRDASGRELLLALVVAYEVVTRFARSYHLPAGVLHSHGVLSPIASAAATAKLLGHAPETWRAGVTSAISLTAVAPLHYATGGALARNLWTGICARTGMIAASYAEAGVGGLLSGPQEVFCDALHATWEPGEMTRGSVTAMPSAPDTTSNSPAASTPIPRWARSSRSGRAGRSRTGRPRSPASRSILTPRGSR